MNESPGFDDVDDIDFSGKQVARLFKSALSSLLLTTNDSLRNQVHDILPYVAVEARLDVFGGYYLHLLLVTTFLSWLLLAADFVELGGHVVFKVFVVPDAKPD